MSAVLLFVSPCLTSSLLTFLLNNCFLGYHFNSLSHSFFQCIFLCLLLFLQFALILKLTFYLEIVDFRFISTQFQQHRKFASLYFHLLPILCAIITIPITSVYNIGMSTHFVIISLSSCLLIQICEEKCYTNRSILFFIIIYLPLVVLFIFHAFELLSSIHSFLSESLPLVLLVGQVCQR